MVKVFCKRARPINFRLQKRCVLLSRAFIARVLLLCLFCLSPAALGAELTNADHQEPAPAGFRSFQHVDTDYLRIEWSLPAVSPESKVARDKACALLGQSLRLRQGAWAFGLFKNFGCFDPEGPGQQPFAGAAPPSQQTWRLLVGLKGDRLQFNMTYRFGTGEHDEVLAASVLAWGKGPDFGLDDQQKTALNTAILLDALPANIRFAAVHRDPTEALAAHVPLPRGIPLPPEELRRVTLFTWDFDREEQLWAPHVIGEGRLEEVSDAKTKGVWHLTFNTDKAPSTFYAQIATGPGTGRRYVRAVQRRLQDSATNGEPSFNVLATGTEATKALLNQVTSGYVGIRVGHELITPANSILPPETMVGLVGEFRSGLLAGLRVYYDEVVRQSTTIDDHEFYLGWSRFVVGYAFGLNLDFFINRLELAPKIGVWTVESRLADLDAEGNIQYRVFSFHNGLSLGLEGSAVVDRQDYLLRAWYARDFSAATGKVGVKDKTDSVRVGIDAVLKGPSLGSKADDPRLSFLLFGYYEDLLFSQTSAVDGPFSIEFATYFVGGGLGISW